MHNEAANLAGSFSRFVAWFEEHGAGVFGSTGNVEVIFAEDGSTDDTVSLLRDIAGRLACPVSVLHSKRRLGKGGGFKNGFLHARGSIVILYDVDLSVSPDQLVNLVRGMDAGADIVIGCRNDPRSAILSRPTLIRLAYARVLYLLAKMLFFSLPAGETQCGFKAFNRERFLPLVSGMQLTGWLFDLELLLKASTIGFKIIEIPVRYTYLKSSQIHNVKDPIRVFVELLRLRTRVLPFNKTC